MKGIEEVVLFDVYSEAAEKTAEKLGVSTPSLLTDYWTQLMLSVSVFQLSSTKTLLCKYYNQELQH